MRVEVSIARRGRTARRGAARGGGSRIDRVWGARAHLRLPPAVGAGATPQHRAARRPRLTPPAARPSIALPLRHPPARRPPLHSRVGIDAARAEYAAAVVVISFRFVSLRLQSTLLTTAACTYFTAARLARWPACCSLSYQREHVSALPAGLPTNYTQLGDD